MTTKASWCFLAKASDAPREPYPSTTWALCEALGTVVARVKDGRVLWSAEAEPVLRRLAMGLAAQVADRWDAPEVVRRFLATGDPALAQATLDAARAGMGSSDRRVSCAAETAGVLAGIGPTEKAAHEIMMLYGVVRALEVAGATALGPEKEAAINAALREVGVALDAELMKLAPKPTPMNDPVLLAIWVAILAGCTWLFLAVHSAGWIIGLPIAIALGATRVLWSRGQK